MAGPSVGPVARRQDRAFEHQSGSGEVQHPPQGVRFVSDSRLFNSFRSLYRAHCHDSTRDDTPLWQRDMAVRVPSRHSVIRKRARSVALGVDHVVDSRYVNYTRHEGLDLGIGSALR